MNFAAPQVLLHFLWLAPLLLALAGWGVARRRRRLALLVAESARRARLSDNASPSQRAWRLTLLLGAVAALLVAAARPQWGTELIERPSRSRDLLFVLDLSRSMLARDVPPGTRLDYAKWLIRELVKQFPGDRFGLIPFAGTAYLECPLTPNREGFLLFLDDANPGQMPVGGTNLGAALQSARQALVSAESEHRAIILLSDGEDLAGALEPELEKWRELALPVLVVGLGDAEIGSYIQLSDTRFVMDADGNKVRSKLDAESLRRLAAATSGLFVHATPTTDGLEVLARRLRALVPAEQGPGGPVARPLERYQWPLALALLLLFVRLALGERRGEAPARGQAAAPVSVAARLVPPGAAVLLVLALGLGLALVPRAQAQDPPAAPPSIDPATPPPSGADTPGADVAAAAPEDGQAGELRQAMEAASEPAQKAYWQYRLARRQQELGQLPAAERNYDAVLANPGAPAELRAGAWQNLGVMRHQQAQAELTQDPKTAIKSLSEAERHYREALRQAPGPGSAARNQELAWTQRQQAEAYQKLLEEMQQQMQQAGEAAEQADKAQEQAGQPSASPQARDQAREQARQATEQARQATDALQQQAAQAPELTPAQEQAERAKQASDALKQAAEAQARAADSQRPESERQQADQEAREALAQALKSLKPETQDQQTAQPGEKPPEGEEKQPPDGESQQAEQGQGQPEQPQQGEELAANEKMPENAAAQEGQGGEGEPPKDLSQQEAIRLLQAMQDKEKQWREIQRRSQSRTRRPPVERDW